MAHLFQVGAGSGGMAVFDLVARDERIGQVTLAEPDVFQPHNVGRHLLGRQGVGRPKAELAREWLLDRRPDLDVTVMMCDITDPSYQETLDEAAGACDLGVCAADNEAAKFAWDALMRRHGKPWTLGEVLSGGIGGFAHAFVPGGACYGCVASFLQRSVKVEDTPAPDYAAPGGPVYETTIPASRASIHAVASLHALLTLSLLGGERPAFTSLLMTLARVPGVFDEAYRPHRFRVGRDAGCLVCGAAEAEGDLNGSLELALARLA